MYQVRLASERNIDAILLEFKEYATEIDVEFVRKAVRAIGRVAIKLDRSAERCVNVLLELIQTKVEHARPDIMPGPGLTSYPAPA